MVAKDTLEAVCRGGRGDRTGVVALTERECLNDVRAQVRHDDD